MSEQAKGRCVMEGLFVVYIYVVGVGTGWVLRLIHEQERKTDERD